MPNKKPIVKKANAKKPIAKKPVVKKPVAKKSIAKKPVAKNAIAKKPTAKRPVVKNAAAKKPASKKPVAKNAAAKKPTAKRPVVKKPVVKKPVVKKPAAKKPIAKKPVVKKPAVIKVVDEKIIDEIIDVLDEDQGAMIPRPATDDDIIQCQTDLVDLYLEPLPQGYIDFLMKCNGLAWNGIEFYSTYQVSEADNPSSFILMDLVTMNNDFNNQYELDEKVLLGRADEEYYTYNIETQKYEILEFGSSEALEEYDTFAKLFRNTVGGRLGLKK